MQTATNKRSVDASNVAPLASNESGERAVMSLPDELIVRLLGFLSMSERWSSYAAPKPTLKAVAGAIEVLQQWYPIVLSEGAELEVAPALDGGVDITIDRGEMWLSVLLRNDGDVEVERSDELEVVVAAPSLVDAHMHWMFGKS